MQTLLKDKCGDALDMPHINFSNDSLYRPYSYKPRTGFIVVHSAAAGATEAPPEPSDELCTWASIQTDQRKQPFYWP